MCFLNIYRWRSLTSEGELKFIPFWNLGKSSQIQRKNIYQLSGIVEEKVFAMLKQKIIFHLHKYNQTTLKVKIKIQKCFVVYSVSKNICQKSLKFVTNGWTRGSFYIFCCTYILQLLQVFGGDSQKQTTVSIPVCWFLGIASTSVAILFLAVFQSD